MNKKLLFAGFLSLLSVAASAQEIKVYDTHRKWSPTFDALIEGQTVKHITTKGVQTQTSSTLLRVNITTTVDASEDVAKFITEAGYEAEAITNQFVTASIPARFFSKLGEQADVLYIEKSRQFHKMMDKVRSDIGADKAQAGTSLDTPYDGTGVIVGVIDQGFEYGHIAFKDASKRWGSNVKNGSLRATAPAYDKTDDGGHATHVSNIAIGRKVAGSNYHGVAPGAEFVPIASDFSDDAIISQAKSIKTYAENSGKPWVINMSFGSNIGPHDGSTSYDQSMNQFCGKGGIMVVAMGNSGDINYHVAHTFTADGETVYLYMKPDAYDNEDGAIMSNIMVTEANGKENLTVRPVVFYNGKLYRPTDSQLKKAEFTFASYINPYSNRQNVDLSGIIPNLCKVLNISNSNSCCLMYEIVGKKGITFHAWVEPEAYPATFASITKTNPETSQRFTTLKGDSDYSYGDGAVSIPSAISVASYNTTTSFNSIDGYEYEFKTLGTVGGLSTFSSKGPYIGADIPTPTVAAPGGCVISAYSKNYQDFEPDQTENVLVVTSNGKKYYYGVMNGTSMATPVVTGTIALWLQANPDLTPDDVRNIIKNTSRHDANTGGTTPSWDKDWGYGKIDAYEGLKQAIQLRTAINETYNTPTPVSISKGGDAWKILFNNDESFADIKVIATNGQVVKSQHIASPHHGSEYVINLSDLSSGVYLLHISTTASTATKKIVVK